MRDGYTLVVYIERDELALHHLTIDSEGNILQNKIAQLPEPLHIKSIKCKLITRPGQPQVRTHCLVTHAGNSLTDVVFGFYKDAQYTRVLWAREYTLFEYYDPVYVDFDDINLIVKARKAGSEAMFLYKRGRHDSVSSIWGLSSQEYFGKGVDASGFTSSLPVVVFNTTLNQSRVFFSQKSSLSKLSGSKTTMEMDGGSSGYPNSLDPLSSSSNAKKKNFTIFKKFFIQKAQIMVNQTLSDSVLKTQTILINTISNATAQSSPISALFTLRTPVVPPSSSSDTNGSGGGSGAWLFLLLGVLLGGGIIGAILFFIVKKKFRRVDDDSDDHFEFTTRTDEPGGSEYQSLNTMHSVVSTKAYFKNSVRLGD